MTDFRDAEFLDRFRRRDPESIAQVVDAFLPHVLNAARGSGLDEATAEDVVQNTFRTLIEKAGDFEGRSQIRTFLFGIFYRKLAEARRGLDRQRRREDIDTTLRRRFGENGRWREPPQVLKLEGEDLAHALTDCLAGLSTQQQTAFRLREVEEMTSEEICKILEVSRTHLGVLLFRARNRLRECLETKGVAARKR
jgi:RNA polymerase sigma-70 factor (ECF subfamily)